MKSAASLTLSFLLFAFITKIPLAFSNDGDVVLDVDQNPINLGGTYNIFPATRVEMDSGGVSLAQTGDLTCPVTVLQDYSNPLNVIPVRFLIPDEIFRVVSTGTPLDIVFAQRPDCAESPKWLVFVDNDIQKACVGIGGPGNYPGKQTLSGTFNVQKSNVGYKLVFCVSGSPTCMDIGRYDNGEGGRRLILTENEPFEIIFERGRNNIRSVA